MSQTKTYRFVCRKVRLLPSRCFLSIVLVFFLFVCRLGFAQSAIPTFSTEQLKTHGRVTVLILVTVSSGEENKTVKDILSQSIRIEVENAGFKAETRSLSVEKAQGFLKDKEKLNAINDRIEDLERWKEMIDERILKFETKLAWLMGVSATIGSLIGTTIVLLVKHLL